MELTDNKQNVNTQELITRAEFSRRLGIEVLGGKPLSRAWATNFFKKNLDLVNADGLVDYYLSVERYQTTKDATRNMQRLAAEKKRGIDQVPGVPQVDRIDYGIDEKTRTMVFDDVLKNIRDLEQQNKLDTSAIGRMTQKEQLVKAMFDSKMAELKYYKELGRSADIEDVIAANAQIVTAIRSKILALPPKVSPKLVNRAIHEIEARLLDAVNEILTELNSLSTVEVPNE